MVKILCVIGSFVAYEVIWDFDAMLDDRGWQTKSWLRIIKAVAWGEFL